MTNILIRAAALALAACWSAHAGATAYYVSDCQASAAAGCQAGDDAKDGKTPATAWRTAARVATAIGTLQAGDEVRFARGGSFDAFHLRIFNPNSTAAAPIVFDAYLPPQGTPNWARPILSVPAGSTGLDFEDSGNADHDEGYVVRDLDLRGGDSSASGGTGIFLYNDVDHVTLDHLSISGFAIGVDCAGSNAPNAGSDGLNEYITLRRSTIAGNGVQGWYNGGCSHVLIEENQFDDNGFAGPVLMKNHNIYIGDTGDDVTVRRNRLTRSAVGAQQCQGVPLVAHGQHARLLIEGNVIDESTGAGGGCYGIQVNPGYPGAENLGGTVIRGNLVVNVGGNGISVGACPDCRVENNRIVQTVPRTFFGINMPAENIAVGVDAADMHLTVRNNTIYVARGTPDSVGIRVGTYGAQHVVVSNLVYYGEGSANPACFSTPGLTRSSFTAFDDNLCFSAGTGLYGTAYATLAAAQAGGFDLHGVAQDPLFAATPSAANGWNVALAAGSPAIGTGHPTLSIVAVRPNIGWNPVTPKAPAGVTVR